VSRTAVAGLSGGWAHGPAEAWAFALGLAQSANDRDRRIAMLIVDNAAELALRTYLGLHRRQRGGPAVDLPNDPSFHALVEGFERCFGQWPEGLSRSSLLWMHEVRNTLHHRGNGLTPDRDHLDGYITAVEGLLRFLFGNKPVEEALSQVSASPPMKVTAPVRPAIIERLDLIMARIRTRQAELGSAAPLELVVPMRSVLEIAQEAEDMLADRAPDWHEQELEAIANTASWVWEADGLPPTVEASLEELATLRTALVAALM
jgi:hypothetical protein